MDANTLREMLVNMVPFIKTVGLEIGDIEVGSATATLPDRREVQNHLGTAHAGAVYTLGESASGAVLLSLFADEIGSGAFIALKSSQVKHKKAVTGDVLATARAREAQVAKDAYEETGKVDLEVEVALAVGEVATAEILFTWAVRAPR